MSWEHRVHLTMNRPRNVGHVNTIDEVSMGRRRRRRYSQEFKAQVVAACLGAGVSLTVIALHHKLNANLLRRSYRDFIDLSLSPSPFRYPCQDLLHWKRNADQFGVNKAVRR
jgi:hypothetical protein